MNNTIVFSVEIACELNVRGAVVYSILEDMADINQEVFVDLRQLVRRFPLMDYGAARRAIHGLDDLGYISILSDHDKVDRLSQAQLDNPYGHEVCEWCKSQSITLEGHHYPIPRSEGGVNVVNICPNCHSAFHHSYLVRLLGLKGVKEKQ